MRVKRASNSSVRKAVSAGQARLVLNLALVAALFTAVGVFHASSRVAVVKTGYDLGKVEREYRELLREHEHLKMERATLRSAARLEAIAKAKLGLAPPVAGQVVSLGSGRPAPAADRTVAAVERPAKTLTP
ncbi:MAG TPA: cell division protein FtsL [Myxococcales bacterium]|jgi:cell division protein FtsL|nr:cell division protein FtsL [Myxococcales bacterium]